jgi:hypothetical protein
MRPAFVDTDHWQVFTDWLFKNSETGELQELRKLPPGAMYNLHWMDKDMRGPDGLALTVMLPDAPLVHRRLRAQ